MLDAHAKLARSFAQLLQYSNLVKKEKCYFRSTYTTIEFAIQVLEHLHRPQISIFYQPTGV